MKEVGSRTLGEILLSAALPDPESYRQDELMGRSQRTVNTRALVKIYI